MSGFGCLSWGALLGFGLPAAILALPLCPALLQLLVQVLVLFLPARELLRGERGIVQQLLEGLQLRQLRLPRKKGRFLGRPCKDWGRAKGWGLPP